MRVRMGGEREKLDRISGEREMSDRMGGETGNEGRLWTKWVERS